MRRPRSILITLGATAMLAGTVAGPAAAEVYSPDARDAGLVASTEPVVGSPDARDAALAATTRRVVASPDARDAGDVARGLRPPTVVMVDPTTDSGGVSSSGIEWADAALGGGIVIALMLLGTGAALSVRRHHRHTGPMAPLAH